MRALVPLALFLAFSLPTARTAAQESPVESSLPREPDARWDAPWDPGTIFLPPLGALDLLFGRRAGELGEDWYGVATLRLPLERFGRAPEPAPEPREARATALSPAPEESPGPPAGTAATRESTSAEEPAVVAVVEERAAAALELAEGESPSPAPERPRRPWTRVALVGLARALGDVLRTEAPELRSLAEVESASSRARSSAWLPELRLRGAHGLDQTVAPATSGVYGAPLTTRGGWDSAFEARLTFRLSRLIYDDGESSLLSMRQKLRAQIEARVEEGLTLLSAWVAAERKLRELELEPEEALEQELLADRAALRLEVLSNGRFGELAEHHLGERSLSLRPPAPDARGR